MATSPAGRMLSRQLQQMQSDKDIPGISCGLVDSNVFEWEVMLMISDDVKLYGGMCCLIDPGLESLHGTHETRRLLLRPPLFPPGISPYASQDEIRVAAFSPE